MTGSDPHRALAEAVAETLETMFFITCADDASGYRGSPGIGARIPYGGDLKGRLTLRIPSSAAAGIAADFLGQDEAETTGDQMVQVVCEMANMICGSALSRIRPDGEFRLGAPGIAAEEELGESGSGRVRIVEACAGPLKAELEMDE